MLFPDLEVKKTQKMYSFNLMPVWGVSLASSDQWKVNSLHFLFHCAVLIFVQLLLPFSLRLVSFNPWDWSDCHRLDKLTSAWKERVFCGILTHAWCIKPASASKERCHFVWGAQATKRTGRTKPGRFFFFLLSQILADSATLGDELRWKVKDK